MDTKSQHNYQSKPNTPIIRAKTAGKLINEIVPFYKTENVRIDEFPSIVEEDE